MHQNVTYTQFVNFYWYFKLSCEHASAYYGQLVRCSSTSGGFYHPYFFCQVSPLLFNLFKIYYHCSISCLVISGNIFLVLLLI